MTELAGLDLRPAAAHGAWLKRLNMASAAEVEAHVDHIVAKAGGLGIWKRGGFVPLQPFILEAKANAALHALSNGFRQLCIDYALHRAGGDLGRLADEVGWSPSERWFLGTGRPIADALVASRSDIFVSGGQPRLIEMNIGTCLNGSSAASALSAALLDSPIGKGMIGSSGLRAGSYADQMVARIGRRRKGKETRVALIGFVEGDDERSSKWVEGYADRFSRQGMKCEFVPVEEAEVADGWLACRGRRYDVAIRYFMVTPEAAIRYGKFFEALEKASNTLLIGSYVGQLFTSKALLADLCQDRRLPANHRRLLKYLPWTARLREDSAWRGDDRVDPIEWAARNRSRAIIKPANLHGSLNVVIGASINESEWGEALEKAVRQGDYVVQERVIADSWPTLYWHLDTHSRVSVDRPVLLGPFTLDGFEAGCYTRQPIAGTELDLLDGAARQSFGCIMSA